MITEKQYKKALEQEKEAKEVITSYYKEKDAAFQKRLTDNPIFTDEELRYSATALCPCGHGLAYPKGCSPHHYWDCSAILKGIADVNVKHEAKLPFAFYKVKGESERNGTTRGMFNPKKESGA